MNFALRAHSHVFFLALFLFPAKEKNMNHKPGDVNEPLQHYSVWLFGHTEMSDYLYTYRRTACPGFLSTITIRYNDCDCGQVVFTPSL